MSKSKSKSNSTNNRRRLYEADTLALESLRLMAAPNPKDDLSDEELENFGKQQRYPAEMIQSLIEYVKSL